MSSFNAVKVALVVIQLATVWGSKLRGHKFSKGEKEVGIGNIGFKFKAAAFVDLNTSIAEIGALRILDSSGRCLNCDISADCSSPNEPVIHGDDVNKACNPYPEPGKKWSWYVDSTHHYDIMIEFPGESLNNERNFTVQVFSAVHSSGSNTAELKKRQVTQWSAAALHRTGQYTASFIRLGFRNEGNYTTAVNASTDVSIPAEASDLFVELCTSPLVSPPGYIIVAETNLERGRFNVEASCASDYIGTATAVECGKDGGQYMLQGCDPVA